MNIVFLFTGLAFVFCIGWLLSSDRKHIRYKNIAVLLALQLIISFLCLNTSGGVYVLSQISTFFSWLIAQADGGVNFVFGGIVIKEGGFVFFFGVLMPIVFISALVGILNYIKVLPFIIKWTGWLLNKVANMGELESYFAISTAVLGQPEVYLTIKDQIPKLTEQRLYTICTSAMSAVSAAMLASYMKMVPGKYVVVAVFLNILSALIISCIINPYKPEINDKLTEIKRGNEDPFFQVLGTYILDGFKLAITVGAMLIGFVSLVTFLNNTFIALLGTSFVTIIGYVFAPIAFLMGVPSNEILSVGGIMATKLITNEFVAMGILNGAAAGLSAKANAIIAVYLISFANFGTVGIVSGSIKAISEKAGLHVARFSMKLLIGATLASVISATIVGIYF
ncbi:NupC/NupG family nucleoside CNT transporter [Pectinatus frisingensis]|uniref:NupC/NupG family nucleoside CNT transporter n=1 Tax=Pectinatus frisingensis TaxID=865 RepID=UPI0018C70A8E|nr:nucleoside transporter C-terminal domain-containing protein [Pectinatus frisingensis]